MTNWIFAAIASAFLWGAIQVVSKQLMEDVSSLRYTALYSLLATAFYSPMFLFFVLDRELVLTDIAIIATAVSGLANILGFFVYNHAIKTDEISVVAPFAKFAPIFTALLGFWILGESLTALKILGVTMVTAGAYTVLSERKGNWRHPLSQFQKRRGPKIAVLSALVWSVAAIADRIATQVINPGFFTFFIYSIMSTAYVATIKASVTHTLDNLFSEFKRRKSFYIFVGVATATASYLVFYSFSKAAASAVVPVLQVELFIPVIAGILFFKEKNMVRKSAGSLLILGGVVLVVV